MRRILWTRRAQNDLAAIESFIAADSARYAAVVRARIIAAIKLAARFPESGRVVPELQRDDVRESIYRPYRIVYRLVGSSELHVLTIHHSARWFPEYF